MVWSASSTESSAPMVTGFPSASSPTVVRSGSPPSAMQRMTMSRSVIMPASRSSSPQIGSDPTPRSRIFLAASTRVSLVDAHSASPVMISRAVFMTTSLLVDVWSHDPCTRDAIGYTSAMPSIERTLTVHVPLERVWEYLTDFVTTEEWDPPTVSTTLVSGDGDVGSVYKNVSRIL